MQLALDYMNGQRTLIQLKFGSLSKMPQTILPINY